MHSCGPYAVKCVDSSDQRGSSSSFWHSEEARCYLKALGLDQTLYGTIETSNYFVFWIVEHGSDGDSFIVNPEVKRAGIDEIPFRTFQ